MVKALVLAAIAWPLVLAAAVWAQASGDRPMWVVVVYAACSFVCHQIPERSFHTAGAQWPVCARCAGLYVSAPIGAWLAVWSLGRRRAASASTGGALRLFGVAALPTAVTLGAEWAGLAAPSNLVRLVSALPLGAATAFVMLRAVPGPRKAIE